MDKTERRIKFGWIAPTMGVPESGNVPIAIRQEDRVLPSVAEHFDSVWVFDHTLGFGNLDAPYLESWTTLTWLAARYPSLQVGNIVLAMGLRHPPLLAKMCATLQALTGGRVVLGTGAGWRAEEYTAYGYPFPATPTRVEQLDEAIRIIRRMWTEEAPTMEGKYYRIDGAHCSPRPDPAPPVMIGGTGEKLMIPLIARLADWWSVPPIPLEDYRRKRDLLHQQMETNSRRPSDMVQTYAVYNAQLPRAAEDSARWLERLQPFVNLGVTHFMFDCGNVTETEPVERFADEVITPLNRAK